MSDEQERNAKLKQAIVDKAALLIDEENINEATQKAKQLQKDWQKIGITAHKEDRKLWKSFREHCDALFAKRESAKQQGKINEESHTLAVAHTCDEIENIAKTISNVANQTDLTAKVNELKAILARYRRQNQLNSKIDLIVHK